MVEDSGTDEEIPLPNVKTAILSKVHASMPTCQQVVQTMTNVNYIIAAQ